MSDCIFCKILEGEIPCRKIYENDYVFAFLDIAPVNKGHVLVMPKKHVQHIEDAPDDVLLHIMQAVKKIGPAVLEAVGSEAYNLGVNNGAGAGQLVPHLHFHIMPRFPDDGHKLFEGKSLPDEEMDSIKEKIVGKL